MYCEEMGKNLTGWSSELRLAAACYETRSGANIAGYTNRTTILNITVYLNAENAPSRGAHQVVCRWSSDRWTFQTASCSPSAQSATCSQKAALNCEHFSEGFGELERHKYIEKVICKTKSHPTASVETTNNYVNIEPCEID